MCCWATPGAIFKTKELHTLIPKNLYEDENKPGQLMVQVPRTWQNDVTKSREVRLS
jgi:hypothetical protein